jgi:hypothetical protein
MNGQVILQKTIDANEKLIDVSVLKPGPYLVRMHCGEKIATRKIVKK